MMEQGLSSKIYRYNFTKEITELLSEFGKLHQYDLRQDYKKAWDLWVKVNNEVIEKETRRIIDLGYVGNVEDKMYKAARYYFRKKKLVKQDSSEERKTRTYIKANEDLLRLMDIHIKDNIELDNYSPAWGFDNFCKNNMDYDKNYISSKKKTYKNRYYLYKILK
jgi:hypothetical protein